MAKAKKPLRDLIFGTAVRDNRTFDIGTLILRLIFGLSMALGHGMGKLPASEKFVEGLQNMGLPFPGLLAWCAGLSEFAGGLCLAIGLLTRPSAAFLAITMAVAFFIRHAADPFKTKELALLYFGFSIAMIFLGSGRLALDEFIRKRK